MQLGFNQKDGTIVPLACSGPLHVARQSSMFQLKSRSLQSRAGPWPHGDSHRTATALVGTSSCRPRPHFERLLSFANLPQRTQAPRVNLQAGQRLSGRVIMDSQQSTVDNDVVPVTAEPSLTQAAQPAVVFPMKRQRKPEHWEFISLVPKSEFQQWPVEKLTSAEAGSAYCHQCKTMLVFAKSQTSSITNHMRVYHPDHLVEYPKRKKARTQPPLANAFAAVPPPSDTASTVRATKEQTAHFKTLLAQWCASSNRPLDIVSDKGLEDAIKYVTEGIMGLQIEMPSRNAVATEVRVLASQLRASLKALVERDAKFFTATTDIWTDRAMRSYISLTIHYLDANFTMNDWTLEVEPLPGMHSGKDIAGAIRSIYDRWHLKKEDCVRLVRDGAKNAKTAANELGIDSFSCYAHCLHLVVSSALIKKRDRQQITSTTSRPTPLSPSQQEASATATTTDDADDLLVYLQELACEETVQFVAQHLQDDDLTAALASTRDTVQTFRALAVYFKNSAKAKHRLESIRNDVQKDVDIMFALDCPTRWSSSWEMLAHFVQLELTVYTFFAYLGTPDGKREFSNPKLTLPTPDQWFTARCLLRLLQPFALAVEHLSGSSYPTLTATLPALRVIKAQLMRGDIFYDDTKLANDPETTGPVTALMHTVQAALLKLFRDRFKQEDPLLHWISLLDPRLSDMEHLAEPEKRFAKKLLVNELVDSLEASDEFFVGVATPSVPRLTTPVKAKAKSEFQRAMYGRRVKARVTPPPSIRPANLLAVCQQAVNDYLVAAASVPVDDDPLEWWQLHHQEHPLVAHLARKYLSCVATSVPSERAFSTGGNVVTIKRCALTPSIVRDMVFISQNTKQEASS